MSEGLWRKFADWAIEFDRTEFYSDDIDEDWDRIAFHARGLELARWLKEEVGDTYRVVYEKPCEDPEYQVMSVEKFWPMESECHYLRFDPIDEVLGLDSGALIFPRQHHPFLGAELS
jgi:hypothetical protein